MIRYLSELPEALAYLISLGAFWLFAVGGLLVARRLLDRAGVPRTQPVMAGWATCLAALTALLFTFVIANVWLGTNQVRARVNGEAAAIRMLARDVSPAQRDLLRAYARSEANDEWPKLCGGDGSPITAAALQALEVAPKPTSDGVRNDMYSQLAVLENLRYDRLQAAKASIPTEIYVALVVLAALMLIVTFFGHHENLWFHLGLTLALATALATLFWLTLQFDYPFCGGAVMGPGAIQDAIRSIR
ncbi:MAG: DUF4239 domain-containing protein [Candidatus Eremiobacteraeota bacterium]|nr:DUF4239 domain-containing protein [Candidatus Eremiobacteraeota bacterium]